MKDVMRHQLGEGGKPKKRLSSAETASQRDDQSAEVVIDEIDPADFIDPDEFGVRRTFGSFDP
jgi:hypothetical protein